MTGAYLNASAARLAKSPRLVLRREHTLSWTCILMCCQQCAGLQALKAYKLEDFVGICGFASLDWVTADFADTYSGEASLLGQRCLL